MKNKPNGTCRKVNNYIPKKRKSFITKIILSVILLGFVTLITSGFVLRSVYLGNLKALNINDSSQSDFTVVAGESNQQIAQKLYEQKLVKSSWSVVWYLRVNGKSQSIQAGTFSLSPKMSVEEIIKVLSTGKVSSRLVTILPAQRIDQIKTSLIKEGFAENDVEDALDPDTFKTHPALVDKPDDLSLEGYLYPETFRATDATRAKDIIKLSLDETAKILTPEIRQKISKAGLTVHQAITLASIVEQEEHKPADKPKVAKVFLNRIAIGMQLGSDVTAFYASDIAGVERSVFIDSPYNTRKYGGLPPGPISNFSIDSLIAITAPADIDYLFFVAGDDGVTYYGRTEAEHNQNVSSYCKKLCN